MFNVLKEVASQAWTEQPLENPAVGWNPDTPALQGEPWKIEMASAHKLFKSGSRDGHAETVLEIHDLETLVRFPTRFRTLFPFLQISSRKMGLGRFRLATQIHVLEMGVAEKPLEKPWFSCRRRFSRMDWEEHPLQIRGLEMAVAEINLPGLPPPRPK